MSDPPSQRDLEGLKGPQEADLFRHPKKLCYEKAELLSDLTISKELVGDQESRQLQREAQ